MLKFVVRKVTFFNSIFCYDLFLGQFIASLKLASLKLETILLCKWVPWN